MIMAADGSTQMVMAVVTQELMKHLQEIGVAQIRKVGWRTVQRILLIQAGLVEHMIMELMVEVTMKTFQTEVAVDFVAEATVPLVGGLAAAPLLVQAAPLLVQALLAAATVVWL